MYLIIQSLGFTQTLINAFGLTAMLIGRVKSHNICPHCRMIKYDTVCVFTIWALFMKDTRAVADLRGPPPASPMAQKILNFMQFLENLTKSYVGVPWRISASPIVVIG